MIKYYFAAQFAFTFITDYYNHFMKKILIPLLLASTTTFAQKVSLGVSLGVAPASSIHTAPEINADDKILPSFYSALDLTVSFNKDVEAVLSLANTRVETRFSPGSQYILQYADGLNQIILKVNKSFVSGKNRFHIGASTGFSYYQNLDSTALWKISPEKYPITDNGKGILTGIQAGYRYAISSRLDLGFEMSVLYNMINAKKGLSGTFYPISYSYATYPISIGLKYKFGIKKGNKNPDERQGNGGGMKHDSLPKGRKRKVIIEDEWR